MPVSTGKLTGILLARQDKAAQAIAILDKLTVDFPSLPEPYNNLAVLYAAQGDFRLAQFTLEKAIQIKPDYLTAYKNLGDVYAELASQAYEKASALDTGSTGAPARAAARKITARAGMRLPSANPVPLSAPQPAPSPAPAVEPPLAAPGTDTIPTGQARSERNRILATLTGWSQAWSERNVPHYLAFYSDDFETPNGESRPAWVAARTVRIQEKHRISVSTRAPQVKVDGDTATVSFLQIYTSDSVTANNRKTLELVRHGPNWRIRRERVDG